MKKLILFLSFFFNTLFVFASDKNDDFNISYIIFFFTIISIISIISLIRQGRIEQEEIAEQERLEKERIEKEIQINPCINILKSISDYVINLKLNYTSDVIDDFVDFNLNYDDELKYTFSISDNKNLLIITFDNFDYNIELKSISNFNGKRYSFENNMFNDGINSLILSDDESIEYFYNKSEESINNIKLFLSKILENRKDIIYKCLNKLETETFIFDNLYRLETSDCITRNYRGNDFSWYLMTFNNINYFSFNIEIDKVTYEITEDDSIIERNILNKIKDIIDKKINEYTSNFISNILSSDFPSKNIYYIDNKGEIEFCCVSGDDIEKDYKLYIDSTKKNSVRITYKYMKNGDSDNQEIYKNVIIPKTLYFKLYNKLNSVCINKKQISKEVKEEGIVYLMKSITNRNIYKIGVTNRTINERLYELNNNDFYKDYNLVSHIHFKCKDYKNIESKLHVFFKEYRLFKKNGFDRDTELFEDQFNTIVEDFENFHNMLLTSRIHDVEEIICD